MGAAGSSSSYVAAIDAFYVGPFSSSWFSSFTRSLGADSRLFSYANASHCASAPNSPLNDDAWQKVNA